MKSKSLLVCSLLSICLASCGDNNLNDSNSNDLSNNEVPSVSEIISPSETLELSSSSENLSSEISSVSSLEEIVDDTDNISDVREMAAGQEVIIEGVVAKVTYAFGMTPQGFFLTDNTGSIYVYGKNAAASVSIGNKVKISGEKAYYVLESEQSNADKWGYKGCCQIASPEILENDNGNNRFDLSWVEETTIKDIIETPVSENITTKIYKVDSYVRKVPGDGFTNYYFNDIDGVTGSYVYTSNNGSDFSYLNEFDGKICSVYLTAINCKSTSTGCIYRFIPINVTNENYSFDFTKAPNYAIKYHVADQFLNEYAADPSLELISCVSSELLGFNDVSISYSSNNTDVVYFESSDDKVIMHTNNVGTATVTVNATYQGNTASQNININVVKSDEIESMSVLEAIQSDDNTKVTVKGVVAASVVNQNSAFYLSDETGLIAIRLVSTDELSKIEIGNEIIVTGTKKHVIDDGKTNMIGQIAIDSATIEVNNYGTHEYSTASFTETTFADIYTLTGNVNNDVTAQGYTLSAKIVKTSNQYSTNYYIASEDGTTKIQFYAGNGKQYSVLEPFVDQVVTVEIAICNWNSKSPYKVCLLSVVTENGKVVNTLNFNK